MDNLTKGAILHLLSARYDDQQYNEKSVQCKLNKANYAVGTTKKCLDTASEKMHVRVIYWYDIINWLDQWKSPKLVVNWKPLGQNSRVYIRAYVGGTEVKDWSGLLGHNDEYGPYMKCVLCSPSRSTYFNVKVKNASSLVSNST